VTFTSSFRPPLGGLSAVATGASNFALGDFLHDARPGRSAVRERRDICLLRTDMVELKHHDVSFAAIDTRMVKKVGDHFVLVLIPTPFDLLD